MVFTALDIKYMRRALALAEKAWGRTSPNPMVGAVIVKDGDIIGEGYRHKAGEPHAEVNAIRNAEEEACRGAVIYVTLEPCSTTGRTPPCTEAIINAGLSRVVIGSLDPNPEHAGKAVSILEKAGIDVVCGVEKEKCDALNEAFFKWITTGRPFVLLKMAMTLDGKIATSNGDSKWVTGPDARGRVQYLRRWADAIMVGGETARKDHPSLNVREPEDWDMQPRRLIVTSSLSQDELTSLMPGQPEPEVFAPEGKAGWLELLDKLGSENVTSILIEGGGELASTVLSAGIVDKVEFHIATKILGGRNSRPVVGGENPLSLAESLQLKNVTTCTYGNDIAVTGYLDS